MKITPSDMLSESDGQVDSTARCLPSNPAEQVAAVLNFHCLRPTRISEMPEGSQMFEFLDDCEACVEVYPTREIVLVVKRGPVLDLYELTTSEVNLIVPILKDALRSRM